MRISLSDDEIDFRGAHPLKLAFYSDYLLNFSSVRSFQADLKLFSDMSEVNCTKRVLLVGSGGREHAIAHKLSESNFVSHVFVSPGNGGTACSAKITNIKIGSSNSEIVQYAIENKIALVVVGPEQPLVDGLCDALREKGVLCFGPSAKAAQLEASKAWSKEFMQRHSIRTASFKNFRDFNAAQLYIESLSHRVVIKASGLAAGKGVIIPMSAGEAVQAAREILLEGLFGDAGVEIVVEEFLEGEEVSVLAFCDGRSTAVMPGAQVYIIHTQFNKSYNYEITSFILLPKTEP
jgi:phosphoribosylamine--glycine ligase / phosphoribosylformylglycinamidine cyclo-ligase